MEERTTIVKLQAHVTGKLQPLDVCCFGPLNMERRKKLNEKMNLFGPRETILQLVFVDLLSENWCKCILSVEFMTQPVNHEPEAMSDLSIFQKHTIKPNCSSTPQLQSERQCYYAELGPITPGHPW